MPATELDSATVTVPQLRHRWKPNKERLLEVQPSHPTHVRFHRACSWLSCVERMEDGSDLDLALISQWICFNSLYGRWNERAQEPMPDRDCWKSFLESILDLDVEGRISSVLLQHRKLVMSLLDDEYLSSFFWRDPCDKRAGQARRAKFQAQTWYFEKNWRLILDRMMERIYLLRCQLVHGASTHGGKLNRRSLRRCSTMLGHLLPAFLLVFIDHGADEDWGTMCYPPLHNDGRQPGMKTGRRVTMKAR